jgi:hypothetical protein
MPVYDEIAHIPLLIYHPDFADAGGTRRKSLTQTVDIMPTILDMAGLAIPDDVTGKSLLPLLARDDDCRDSLVFGYFGAAVNVCDGRYSYFHYPVVDKAEHLFEYTLMPTRMTARFSIRELLDATLHSSFSFTKGVPVLKLPPKTDDGGVPVEVQGMPFADQQSQLFDLQTDPGQTTPLDDPEKVAQMCQLIIDNMVKLDAPAEAYSRFGFVRPDQGVK